LILYHNDLDGAASAAIVQFVERSAHGMPSDDFVTRPIRYGEDVHAVLDEVGDDYCQVFVVDWTPPQGCGGIEALSARLGDRLVWIDHHASAIQGYGPDEQQEISILGRIRGIRLSESDGQPIAACELTWVHLWARWLGSVPSPPKWLQLIGDWDTWRHAKIPDSVAPDVKRYFDQYGIDEMRSQLETLLFKSVTVDVHGAMTVDVAAVDRVTHGIVDVGRIFGKFERAQDAELMRARGFEGTFDGIPAILANFEQRGSMRFESMYDPTRHKIMVGFAYDNTGMWTVSVYSEDPGMDCAEMCKRLGNAGPYKSGGGHRGAAGFQTDWAHLQTLIVRSDGTCLA
jgi:hypothetical protein